MLSLETALKPVCKQLEMPDVFFGARENIGPANADAREREEVKHSCLDFAFFFRSRHGTDVSLVRHTLKDPVTGHVERVPTPEVINLSKMDGKALKRLFWEIFQPRLMDYDDVHLIAEALAQNCLEQFSQPGAAGLSGSFKLSIDREVTTEGVVDFSLSLSSMRQQFVGLDVLEGKCEVIQKHSRKGLKHKVVIKPVKLKQPESRCSTDEMEKEVADVFEAGGSIMIPERGERRRAILNQVLKGLQYTTAKREELFPKLEVAVSELEQEGHSFEGRGIVVYSVKEGAGPRRFCFVTKPLSKNLDAPESKINALKTLFAYGLKKRDKDFPVGRYFSIDSFEAESYYFGPHGCVELSRP